MMPRRTSTSTIMAREPRTLPVVQHETPLMELLEPRELAFVTHPDVFIEPVKAALAVGYSEATARGKAHQMRKQLMYYIRPLHDARVEASGVTIDALIEELKAIAFANEPDYWETVDVEGDTIKVPKDPTRLPERMKKAIKSVSYDTVVLPDGSQYQRLTKVDLYDKIAALKELKSILGADDPMFRKPPAMDAEEQELLEHMEPEELELVGQVYAKAEARARKLASRKRDQKAIPGKANGQK